MQITSAQFPVIVEALTVVLPLTSPADVTLKFFFRDHPKLGQRDRAVVAETVYSVLRHRRWLEYVIPDGTPRRMALLALSRFAGLSSADIVRLADKDDVAWFEGLVSKLKTAEAKTLPLGVAAELPDWVVECLQCTHRDDEILQLGRSMQNAAPLDVRVNTHKIKREQVMTRLLAEGIECKATPYSALGIRLAAKIALNHHPLFLNGDIEVQDEGSQLLGLLVDARRGQMVVDFCAGAGGKTLLLGAVMASTGRLYAFDISEKRLANLAPRLKRSGLSNITPQRITNENDTRIKRLAGKVDRVLVDAPCTGLGTLRRNPDLKWRQSLAGVAELNVKQSAILNSAARLVKSGGRLIYATCSLLEEENEHIVNGFLDTHPNFQLMPPQEILDKLKIPLPGMGKYLKLSPQAHGSDGFFAAVMERKAQAESSNESAIKGKRHKGKESGVITHASDD